jgi:hypothetical protein
MRLLRVLPSLVLVLAWTSGCVVDASLDATGGGRLTVRYRLVSVANFESMKTALQHPPEVTLTEATMTPEKRATFGVAFGDLRTLSTAPALANTRVALEDEPDGLRTLTVRFTGPRGSLAPSYIEYLGREFRLSLAVPGDVVRSNATTVVGRSATWVRPLAELQHEAEPTFRVTYRPVAAS